MIPTTDSKVKIDAKFRVGWLLYLLLTIGTIGLCVAPFYLPSKILSRLGLPGIRRATHFSDKALSSAIALLMRVQPWHTAKVSIQKPLLKKHGEVGVLFVSNHRSHLDAFILLAHLPGVQILAKRSLFFIPFLNLFMWAGRQIAVARGDVSGFLAAMEEVGRRLADGATVHVFPEMTRCDFGFEGTNSFSLAPFHAAKKAGALVVPVVFRNTDLSWTRAHWGIRRSEGVEARSLSPLRASDFESAQSLREEVRRSIVEALR